MTIVELKNKINELDKLMDDESISNEQFDEYGREIARLYAEIAKIEAQQELTSARECAKGKGFKIVGKLTRKPEWEKDKKERWYMDEAGNEYYKRGDGFSIITADGGVI